MKIDGKVHLLFEQSGTFKREFEKMGYTAEDYDIQNNFGETDNVIDLFAEIDTAYTGGGERIRQDRYKRLGYCVLPVHIFLRYKPDVVLSGMRKLSLSVE